MNTINGEWHGKTAVFIFKNQFRVELPKFISIEQTGLVMSVISKSNKIKREAIFK